MSAIADKLLICAKLRDDAKRQDYDYDAVVDTDALRAAADTIDALYEAAEYALGVIGSTNRFDPEQCQAATDALTAALAKAVQL